jgi:branched-chain amino acid transport system ATP-binding protein
MNRTASTLEPSDVQESAESLLLRCGQVCANYGPIQVCFGINISVSPKEIIAVLGPNGAGKSSFLGALAGIVSNRGSVRLGECELMGLPPHRRAHAGLAFVPEVRGNIFPALSVEENLRLPLQWLARNERTNMREKMYDLFPILKTRNKTEAGMLSGGEQQMLAIAMAVSRRPTVLMLDEPTQGLAPAVFDILESVIGKFVDEGIAVIVAEQNMKFVSRIATRYVVLSGGKLVGSGMREDLNNEAEIVKKYFLGKPN